MRPTVTRLLAVLSLCLPSAAFAETLVVYPFASQDVFLGVAIADRLAQAFEGVDGLEVVGPEVSSGLVPPLVAEDGFFSLLRLADPTASAFGAQLLRETLGADAAVAGALRFEDDEVIAEVYIADAEGRRSFEVSAESGEPGRLVGQIRARLQIHLDVDVAAAPAEDIDLSSAYGSYVEALGLLAAGDAPSAAASLAGLQEDEAALAEEPRIGSLAADLRALQIGEPGENAGLLATGSLSLSPVDEELSLEYFSTFADETELPVAELWLATLAASAGGAEDGDASVAGAAFDVAAELYPFGRVADAAFDLAGGEDVDLSAFVDSENVSSLLAIDLLAQVEEDVALRKVVLNRLTRLAPTFVYPFNELSFIAFDEDDPLTAAQVLSVATRLEPVGPLSDLYWTNLGWAYYLLGFLDRSEEASVRAVELDPTQEIALFNLGLARVVEGRLDDAMEAYAQALAIDPAVNDAALEDLVNALELYPDEPAIYYPLAVLYEQEGQREQAAEAFEAYLELDSGGDAFYANNAERRVEVLTAPPPPLEISEGVNVLLGQDGPDGGPFRPGDRLFPNFELYTPGAELPRDVTVRVSLSDQDGTLITEETGPVSVPQNAIGYVVSDFGLSLPPSLPAGSYLLRIEASTDRTEEATGELSVEVAGEPSYLRQLLSRDIVMLQLADDTLLYDSGDLSTQNSALIARLRAELEGTAEAAEEALPAVETGRFAGQSGGEVFAGSSAEDVEDFLTFILSGGAEGSRFHFVDAYAQWVVDGAPTE